jgi:phenylalanyl-tRNA synthetase alpha chain
MFRPEMLQPMGLPEDVNVIAWGLGLERWASSHTDTLDLQLLIMPAGL